MVERISTGVKGLDDMVEGGFERRRVILYAGDSGSGKSTFAASFINEGLKTGEKCLYISLEETTEMFTEFMRRVGLDFKEHVHNQNLIFLHMSPDVLRDKTEGLVSISEALKQHEFQRICVDSITAFMLLYKDEWERRDSLTRLLEILRRHASTIVLTSEQHYDEARFGLSYHVDGVINLLYKDKDDGLTRLRLLEVYKMRGTNHSTKKVFFKIAPAEGIQTSGTQAFG